MIEARKPGLVSVNKDPNDCQNIDIATPGDAKVQKQGKEIQRNRVWDLMIAECKNKDYTNCN